MGFTASLRYNSYHVHTIRITSQTILFTPVDVGATAYHMHREGEYFNFDNIFALSQFFLYSYTWFVSYPAVMLYFYTGIIGLPLAIGFLIYCGLPAIIEYDDNGKPIKRRDNFRYHIPHVIWHIITAFGSLLITLFVIYYPETLKQSFYVNFDAMILYSLIFGVATNLLLNAFRVAPVD